MAIINPKPKPTKHSFSREFARAHGVNEAILIGYVAHRVRRSKNYRDGKQWFFDTLTDLAKQFPYFSRSTVDNGLGRLEKAALIEFGNYNRWRMDKTRWYHVPQEICDQAARDPIYFDLDVAKKLGIPEAVLIINLRHFIEKQKKARKQSPLEHEMSPEQLAELLPFSKATIKRALKNLAMADLIVKTARAKPVYALK